MRCLIYLEEHWGEIFKPVHIIGCYTDIESFIDGNICIMEFNSDIQNTISESMHSRDINVDSEGVIMFHWTVGLIKINTLNLRTPIYTVT